MKKLFTFKFRVISNIRINNIRIRVPTITPPPPPPPPSPPPHAPAGRGGGGGGGDRGGRGGHKSTNPQIHKSTNPQEPERPQKKEGKPGPRKKKMTALLLIPIIGAIGLYLVPSKRLALAISMIILMEAIRIQVGMDRGSAEYQGVVRMG